MDDARCTMDDARWMMDDARWMMHDAQWMMHDAQCTMDDEGWMMHDYFLSLPVNVVLTMEVSILINLLQSSFMLLKLFSVI